MVNEAEIWSSTSSIRMICETQFHEVTKTQKLGPWMNEWTDLEFFGWNGDPGPTFETGHGMTFWYLKTEDMKQRREEEEQLGFGQDVAETHPPTDAEWNEEIRFVDGTIGPDESFRIKRLGILPQRRIHVNGVD